MTPQKQCVAVQQWQAACNEVQHSSSLFNLFVAMQA